MDLLPSGGFAAAVFFGAVVIWFHAWSQFNRPSYQESADFTRVLRRLQPSDMRRGPVFIQAYVFYALILTFIYLLICIYASVPFLQEVLPIEIAGLDLRGGTAGAQKLPDSATLATGAAFDDAELGTIDASTGPSPALPLLVSLAVVGLAPNVPFLARIEEWIRGRSHRLSGIPTHLIDSGFKLRRERLFDPGKKSGLLISIEEWEQANHYFVAAGRVANRERETLREQVLKIIAFRNWVLRGRVFHPDGATRYVYQHLEAEVRQQVRDLLAKLDALSARSMAATAQENPDETAERSLEWAGIVRETEEICGDVCVLVALYSERDAFASDMKQARSARSESPASDYERERREAQETFMAALRRVSLVTNKDSFGTTVFFRLAGSIVLTATVAGLLLGQGRFREASDAGSIVLAFKYAVTYAIMYALPLFFALGYQQESLRRDHWENFIVGKKSKALAQYGFIFIAATLVALIGLIANNIYFAIADVGLERVADRFDAVLLAAYQIEGPRAMMGGVLAVCMTFTIDAWRAERLSGWGSPWPWGVIGGTTGLLAAMGFLERYWAAVAAVEAGTKSIDWIRVASDTAVAGLVGLVASSYVVQSLMDEFDEKRVAA
jgi:hypothetical protein